MNLRKVVALGGAGLRSHARSLLLAIAALVLCPTQASAIGVYTPDGQTIAIGDTWGDLSNDWYDLRTYACPPGKILTGMRVRHGEWLAIIVPRCSRMAPSGRAFGPSELMRPLPAYAAYAPSGSHIADVDCPSPYAVAGVRGFQAVVPRFGTPTSTRAYAADPYLLCVDPITHAQTEVHDTQFTRPAYASDAASIVYNPRGAAPQQPYEFARCAYGRVPDGFLFRVDGDDIDYFALRCVPLRQVLDDSISNDPGYVPPEPGPAQTGCPTNPAQCTAPAMPSQAPPGSTEFRGRCQRHPELCGQEQVPAPVQAPPGSTDYRGRCQRHPELCAQEQVPGEGQPQGRGDAMGSGRCQRHPERCAQEQLPGSVPSPAPAPSNPSSMDFAPPRDANGTVIAFCRKYDRPNSCGHPAAKTFCHQHGFAHVANFAEGPPARTVTVEGVACTTNEQIGVACRSFASITCK